MPLNRQKLLNIIESYENERGFFRRNIKIKASGFSYTKGMLQLKKFAENTDNFDERGNIKPEHVAQFQKIFSDHKKKRSSKKEVKLTNVLLNKVFGTSSFKKPELTNMTELDMEAKEKLGITPGRHDIRVHAEKKSSDEIRPWIIKDTLPFNEIIFSRLFAIFAPGSAKVRGVEEERYGQKVLLPASRYIEGNAPEQKDFTEEAIKHNGLANYLVASIIFNASDAKLGNIKIDQHGRFTGFDFEEMLPHGTRDFSQQDFMKENILTKPYLSHMDLGDHFDVSEISHSEVFQEEIYKAMIKFLVFPEQLLQNEITQLCHYTGRKSDAEDYIRDISRRFDLLKSEAGQMNGFKEYLRNQPKDKLLETCLHDFYTNSANGRYAAAIKPYEKEITEKLNMLVDQEPSPRRRM